MNIIKNLRTNYLVVYSMLQLELIRNQYFMQEKLLKAKQKVKLYFSISETQQHERLSKNKFHAYLGTK